MVTLKRTRSCLRNHPNHPTHSEAVALVQNKTQTLSETNKSHAHEETEERINGDGKTNTVNCFTVFSSKKAISDPEFSKIRELFLVHSVVYRFDKL
jgi:beta-mannanase